jgi:hypothetical protein
VQQLDDETGSYLGRSPYVIRTSPFADCRVAVVQHAEPDARSQCDERA